jgi:hypothetical protein
MKSLFLATIFLAMLSCNSAPEESNASITKKMLENYPEAHVPTAPAGATSALLIGKWQVDSAGFINDGVQKPLEAPLADSFWEFTKDGKLIISGNISHTANINIVNNTFTIHMMGVDCDYHIKSVDENSLVLVSVIVDTKEMKMETISKFKRLR